MIITIRNQIKHSSFRYVAFFIFVVLGVGMISIPSLMRTERAGASSWALKVNNQTVSYQEFAREVADQSEYLAQIRAHYGQYADLLMQMMNLSTDPQALAFDVLIKNSLISQLAKNMGIAIHNDYISESVNDAQFARQYLHRVIPPFVFEQSGALSPEKLKMFLQHKRMSIQEFENKVDQSLSQLQAMQLLASSTYVPSFDFEQEFVANNLGKSFSYLSFSFDSFLTAEKKNVVSDEDAQIFYDKENIQRRRYWVPEKRDGVMWKFNSQSYNAPVSEEQINEYYEDNKVSKYVLEPLKVEVRQISEKNLPEGVTLEMVEAELLNNPSSEWNKKWESLKPFARGDKKGAFEREAFVLQNEGDISPIVETKNGKVIIQLTKRIARTYKPLSSVRSEIKSVLKEKQFKKQFAKDIKNLVTQGDVQAIEAFIAQKTGKKEMLVGMIKNDTHIAQELFSLKNGEYGFFVDGDTGVIVQLGNIVERNLPDFESIKDVVKGDVREEQAYNKMIEAVTLAKNDAANASFDELARTYNASVYHTGMIQPNDNKQIQDLDEKGLPARTMINVDKEGALIVHNGERVSFLIKVDDIQEYDQNSLDDAQKSMEQQLSGNRMKMQVESIVASLHRNATIETNESTQLADEEYSE